MYPTTDCARFKCALVAIVFAAGEGISVGVLLLCDKGICRWPRWACATLK